MTFFLSKKKCMLALSYVLSYYAVESIFFTIIIDFVTRFLYICSVMCKN